MGVRAVETMTVGEALMERSFRVVLCWSAPTMAHVGGVAQG